MMLLHVVVHLFVVIIIFFFKQKTAYEMRISDWSSDVCSSDLPDAVSVTAHRLDGKAVGTLDRIDPAGLFFGKLSIRKRQPLRYHATYADGGEYALIDPYSFGPVLGPMDDHYFADGSQIGRASWRERVCHYG